MRGLAVLAGSLFLVVACSSTSASESPCIIEGTYLETVKPLNGASFACGETGAPITVTVTARPAGVTGGPDYRLEFPGITGGCGVNLVEECKVQGKCDIKIQDATDPKNATGTSQYSWTFSKTGFTGLSTIAIPPATSLPKGCADTVDVTATRR